MARDPDLQEATKAVFNAFLSGNSPRPPEIIEVTPKIAARWLNANTCNRKIRASWVNFLADKMTRNEFQFNGDAIRFSKSGVLLDGQHRLHAIIKSGVTIHQLVVWNLDDDSQITMDTGAKRTLGHHLDIKGEENSKSLTSTLNMAWQWDRGYRFQVGTSKVPTPSYEQAYEYLMKNPGIRRSVEFTKPLRSKKVMRESTGAVLHWIFSRIDPLDADDFFERLISGVHIDDFDPVWIFREKACDLRSKKLEFPYTLIPLGCKVWNLDRRGETVKSLRMGSQEDFHEPR